MNEHHQATDTRPKYHNSISLKNIYENSSSPTVCCLSSVIVLAALQQVYSLFQSWVPQLISKNTTNMKHEVLMPKKTQITAFWDAAPRSLVESSQGFGKSSASLFWVDEKQIKINPIWIILLICVENFFPSRKFQNSTFYNVSDEAKRVSSSASFGRFLVI